MAISTAAPASAAMAQPSGIATGAGQRIGPKASAQRISKRQ